MLNSCWLLLLLLLQPPVSLQSSVPVLLQQMQLALLVLRLQLMLLLLLSNQGLSLPQQDFLLASLLQRK